MLIDEKSEEVLYVIIFKDVFIYLERGDVGGQGEKVLSRLPAELRGARGGSWSQDPEFTTRVETKSGLLNTLCHPGAPEEFLYFKC